MTCRRFHALPAVVAVMACLSGMWGCQAEKGASADYDRMVAQIPSNAQIAAPGLPGAAILAMIKPFQDCAFASYVKARIGKKGFSFEAAKSACTACSSLLEPFREHVYERTEDKEYAEELADMVEAHAVKVMEEASARAR